VDPSFSIVDRMEQNQVPGFSVAVIHDGKIDWAKGYGIATDETTVDTNTLSQAGSISKPVAAIAALRLVEQNRLNLDINNYLKQWKIESGLTSSENPRTLRHLFSNTGGLSIRWFPGYPSGSELHRIISITKAMP